MKKLLILATLIAAVVPAAFAQAHCENSDVYLFTRYTNTQGLENPTSGAPLGNPSVHTGTVGCPNDESTPAGTPDTALISPGANSFSARWVGTAPATTATVALKQGSTTLRTDTVALVANSSAWVFFDAAKSSDLSLDETFSISVTINGKTRTYRTR